jgi:hypothetical protein
MLDKLDSSVAASIDSIRNVAPKLYEAAVDRITTTALIQLPLWICAAIILYILAVIFARESKSCADTDKASCITGKCICLVVGTVILLSSLGNYVPDLLSPEMPAFKSILDAIPNATPNK